MPPDPDGSPPLAPTPPSPSPARGAAENPAVAPARAGPVVAAPSAEVRSGPAPGSAAPAGVKSTVAVVDAGAPVKSAPTSTPPDPGAGVAGPRSGWLNLRASDTAAVYIDGRKVGESPLLGHQVRVGKHQVRFDCFDDSGEARPGVAQAVTVEAEAERDVEFECPAR